LQQIKFHSKFPVPELKNRRQLKEFLLTIFKKEGYKLFGIDIVFCNDQELLSLNREFLSHNYKTDILTFDLGDSSQVAGEIYISVPTVRSNASFYKVPFLEELHRVVIHGILHLCGYSDTENSLKLKMEKKQEEYLLQYFKQ
jgi:rRNA maturation RNase YbeY